MLPGDRFKNWIDGLAVAWKVRLRGWMASWLGFGIELFFDVLGKSAAPKLKPLTDMLEATGQVPPELKPLLDELKEPTGEAGAMFAQSAGSALIGGALGKIIDAILLPLAYAANSATRNVILSPDQLLWLWRREQISEAQVDKYISWLGYTDDDIKLWKELTVYYPGAAELIHWTAREVFEPTMIAKYGLMAGADKLRREDFYKIGMTDEQIDNHWIAHWEHASWTQVVEMLHRGLITEQAVKDWFPLVEMAPYWADLLIDTAYTWPTRVDVRRWWDMRTIDETELRRLYSGMGYRGVNLDNYILWTKVYVAFPDLMARWSKGWITLEEVRTELTAMGMPAERLEEFIQMKVKAEQPARVESERDLTKSDIIKGVKKEVITWSEGIELLQDMGFSEDEADYVLAINIAAEAGSPETFAEFKDLTTKYKIATGREAKPMPEELKKAGAEVVKLTEEVEALQRSIEEEQRGLIEEEILPAETTARLDELRGKLYQATVERARVKSEYDRLVAEWRHSLP